MRSASEFHGRSVENLKRRWRFVFQPSTKRFAAITARSSAGRRGAEEVAALQGQIQALQIELENPSHALALLRPRRERPGGRSAAEQRNELAPFQCPYLPCFRTKGIAHEGLLRCGISSRSMSQIGHERRFAMSAARPLYPQYYPP